MYIMEQMHRLPLLIKLHTDMAAPHRFAANGYTQVIYQPTYLNIGNLEMEKTAGHNG